MSSSALLLTWKKRMRAGLNCAASATFESGRERPPTYRLRIYSCCDGGKQRRNQPAPPPPPRRRHCLPRCHSSQQCAQRPLHHCPPPPRHPPPLLPNRAQTTRHLLRLRPPPAPLPCSPSTTYSTRFALFIREGAVHLPPTGMSGLNSPHASCTPSAMRSLSLQARCRQRWTMCTLSHTAG